MQTDTMQANATQTSTHDDDRRAAAADRTAMPDASHGAPTARTPVDPDDYGWMTEARCRGTRPTEFFPSDGSGVDAARRVCEECPVRVECLEYALAFRIEHGVWGGASERERRRILRRRRQGDGDDAVE